jgi:hypothetical protein
MKTPSTLKEQISQLEEEIDDLKMQLLKPHLLAKSPEQDLEVKSKIIDKQTEMIELLIKQSKQGKEK